MWEDKAMEPWFDKRKLDRCTAHKPLLMVIPPEGVTISCPVHPEGHFIKGPEVTY